MSHLATDNFSNPLAKIRYLLLTLCCLLINACVFGIVVPVPADGVGQKRLNRVINRTPFTLNFPDLELQVEPGSSFRPSLHADIDRPPRFRELETLDVTALATVSAGNPMLITSRDNTRPVHAYLVLYPVYKTPRAPSAYELTISPADIKKARQGKVVKHHGSYLHQGQRIISWVIWISDKSLDVDCGCA